MCVLRKECISFLIEIFFYWKYSNAPRLQGFPLPENNLEKMWKSVVKIRKKRMETGFASPRAIFMMLLHRRSKLLKRSRSGEERVREISAEQEAGIKTRADHKSHKFNPNKKACPFVREPFGRFFLIRFSDAPQQRRGRLEPPQHLKRSLASRRETDEICNSKKIANSGSLCNRPVHTVALIEFRL